MRFRIRLMAAGAATAACVTFGLTAAVPALASTGATVKSTSLGGCLYGNANINGGVAERLACNGSMAGQQWTLTAGSGGELVNGFNQCLGVQGGSTNPGAGFFITTCQESATQKWTIYITPANNAELQNDKSGLYLHATGSTGVNQENLNDGNVIWTPPAGTGFFQASRLSS